MHIIVWIWRGQSDYDIVWPTISLKSMARKRISDFIRKNSCSI